MQPRSKSPTSSNDAPLELPSIGLVAAFAGTGTLLFALLYVFSTSVMIPSKLARPSARIVESGKSQIAAKRPRTPVGTHQGDRLKKTIVSANSTTP